MTNDKRNELWKNRQFTVLHLICATSMLAPLGFLFGLPHTDISMRVRIPRAHAVATNKKMPFFEEPQTPLDCLLGESQNVKCLDQMLMSHSAFDISEPQHEYVNQFNDIIINYNLKNN